MNEHARIETELAWLPMATGDVLAADTVGGKLTVVEFDCPGVSIDWLRKTQPNLCELIEVGARLAALTVEVERLYVRVTGAEIARLQAKSDALRAESEARESNVSTLILPRLELTDRARILRNFFKRRGNDHG